MLGRLVALIEVIAVVKGVLHVPVVDLAGVVLGVVDSVS